jgi:uncharacterized UBP type Zn finger protein
VGKGHAEFATSRQQDACDYLHHLLDVMTRAERAAGVGGANADSIPSLFKFQTEHRIQCDASNMVKYNYPPSDLVRNRIIRTRSGCSGCVLGVLQSERTAWVRCRTPAVTKGRIQRILR